MQHKTKMAKEKSKEKAEEKSEPRTRTATVEELHQTCPKCGSDLLVKIQSEKGLDYKCYDCKYEEFREWSQNLIKEESEKSITKKKVN